LNPVASKKIAFGSGLEATHKLKGD
jgi:hypothetical protein